MPELRLITRKLNKRDLIREIALVYTKELSTVVSMIARNSDFLGKPEKFLKELSTGLKLSLAQFTKDIEGLGNQHQSTILLARALLSAGYNVS